MHKTVKKDDRCKISIIEEDGVPKSVIKKFFSEKDLLKEFNISNILSSSIRAQREGLALKYPFLMELGKKITSPLSENSALDVARQCVGILADLHSNKIIHRDIKPSNLYLNNQGQLFISDFETALEAKDNPENTCGTPGFMAPEQYTESKVDWLADQYAMGATLFFALTGTYPFKGFDKEELLKAQQSVPDPGVVNAKLKKPYCDLIKTMMQPNKKDRFQTIDELFQAVSLCHEIEKKPVILENKSIKIEAKKKVKSKSRLPLILYIAAALILAALAFKIL